MSGLDLFAAGECCLALLGSRRIFGAVRERKEQQKPAAFETAGFVFSLAETFYAVKRVLCVNRQNA